MDLRLSLFLVFAFATLSYGLDCHVCNSADHADCPVSDFDKDSTTHKQACAEGEFCRKIYQNIRGEESVIRSCGSETTEKYSDDECYTTVLEEYNTEVCACKEPLCNGSPSTVSAVSALSLTLTSLLAYLVSK